jgi:hypothetical protein
MIKEAFTTARKPKTIVLHTDLVVVGGGMSGTCAAITAARAGIKVVLVQDRPVLGGNASSEVRLWILGATSHMGNNNRWAREGGVIDEILVENTFRNKEGNPVILDTLLLEKVTAEPNITLLLNSSVFQVDKNGADTICQVHAFCSQNSTLYLLQAPWFCDASGDGIMAFSAGAAFRMGAESQEEFGEKFAPTKEYGELLGHTLYFYSKDAGRPIKFTPPSYALKDITQIPRYKSFNTSEFGCQLWWIEYGGRLDTVHETEEIKWQLWKIVYGVWDYIKNSGNFPEAANLTLEWVGNIPGKRESRRFEGDYLLKQQDIVGQQHFDDAVAFGGWSIDLHPADGIFSDKPGCNQWHTKGVYQIPLRCYYSRNLTNLFLAGRIISATHVAFGSSRVMATCAHGGQSVGMAAALAVKNSWSQQDLSLPHNIALLQQELLKTGHHIPGVRLNVADNKTNSARIWASSELVLKELPFDGSWLALEYSTAQMLPMPPGRLPAFKCSLMAKKNCTLSVELRISSKAFNHTPDIICNSRLINLYKGENEVELDFLHDNDQQRYVFFCFMKNPDVSVKTSNSRISGLLSVFNKVNAAVSNYGKQEGGEEIGMDSFEFWCPHRRPQGHNIAFQLSHGIELFAAKNINNGIFRPLSAPNCWVAAANNDREASLFLEWGNTQTVKEVVIAFDTDYDHPMESSLMGHPEAGMPFCVNSYKLYNDTYELIYEYANNHQTINKILFEKPITTTRLIIEAKQQTPGIPVAIFEVQVY